MNTGPFSLADFLASLILLPDFIGDGEEFVDVAPDGGREFIVCGGDADAVERGVVAGHVFFGEAGDALPGYGVALAEERGEPDEPEPYAIAPMFGEVYEYIVRASRALAIAGEVASPSFLDPAAPGGVFAEAY
jgi:hypothetical protein